MAGCSHLSMANFQSREDENYKTIISAIKKIRKLALKDTAPTSSGLHETAQEIQNLQVIQSSQATSIHTVQNTSVLNQQNFSLQNAVTATHNTFGARELSHGSSQGTMIALKKSGPAYGNMQDASRIYSATPQSSQFDANMMKIRRRPVGLSPVNQISNSPGHESQPNIPSQNLQFTSGQLGQQTQHYANIAPITALEPKSSTKSGKKPKMPQEAGPPRPAKLPLNPGDAAPRPAVVRQLIGNEGMLSTSSNIHRTDQQMHYTTINSMAMSSSQHISPQPSSGTYNYPPVPHPFPTNHPMTLTAGAMPVQLTSPQKVTKPPKASSGEQRPEPAKLPGTNPMPHQMRPNKVDSGVRGPPIPTTTAGTIPKVAPMQAPPTVQQGLRELQLQPSYTRLAILHPPRSPGFLKGFFRLARNRHLSLPQEVLECAREYKSVHTSRPGRPAGEALGYTRGLKFHTSH